MEIKTMKKIIGISTGGILGLSILKIYPIAKAFTVVGVKTTIPFLGVGAVPFYAFCILMIGGLTYNNVMEVKLKK
ncbi:MAG: hypothetical protein ACRDDY_02755 [Clostridium sp.]|uniref:hypothetical protein n=1 Tax=Clostridium sp. TaxID=1506 RepID=UPI003EE62758